SRWVQPGPMIVGEPAANAPVRLSAESSVAFLSWSNDRVIPRPRRQQGRARSRPRVTLERGSARGALTRLGEGCCAGSGLDVAIGRGLVLVEIELDLGAARIVEEQLPDPAAGE